MVTAESWNESAVREIRKRMKAHGLTQRQLADECDWTQVYVWRRLSGHVPLSLDDVEAIAKVLGVPILALTDPRIAV